MDFEFHKEVEHNLWNYVFYLVYLHTLDEQSLTGFEYFVLTKFKEVSTAWLPVGSTTYLKTSDSHEESIAHLTKQIKDYHRALEDKMDQRFAMVVDAIKELRALVTRNGRPSKLGFEETSRDFDQNKSRLRPQPSMLATATEDRDLHKTDSDRTTSRRRLE
jgi:hypothetical protein